MKLQDLKEFALTKTEQNMVNAGYDVVCSRSGSAGSASITMNSDLQYSWRNAWESLGQTTVCRDRWVQI